MVVYKCEVNTIKQGDKAMRIWLPNMLYQVFPLLGIILGFSLAALLRNPFGMTVASALYIYSFSVLWLRLPDESDSTDS